MNQNVHQYELCGLSHGGAQAQESVKFQDTAYSSTACVHTPIHGSMYSLEAHLPQVGDACHKESLKKTTTYKYINTCYIT